MTYIGFIIAFAVFVFSAATFMDASTNAPLAWLLAAIMIICVFVMANIIK